MIGPQGPRIYFSQGREVVPALMLLDAGLLTRPPEHAQTLAEAIAAICSGHGDAS